MGDKTIYVIAKVFDQRGCLAYRCKTAREARCLPVILDSPDIYSEYAPYEYIEDMKLFIDKVCTLNRAA